MDFVKRYWAFGFCVWVIAFVCMFPLAYGQTKFSDEIAKLIPAAEKEGEVSLFTGSARVTAKDAETFSKAFSQYYGIPLKINFAALGSHPEVIQRLKEEAKVGVKPAVDVFVTSIKFEYGLKQAGLIDSIQWKELGVAERDIIESLYAVDVMTNIRGVVYNTNMVKRADAPHSFEDLLDKKWKGKIVAPGNPHIFPFVALVIGEEPAMKLVERLVKEQKMAFTPTVTDVVTRVANGEFLVGYGFSAGLEKKKGAPVENSPMKVGAFRQCCVVLKGASHPAAAKLLVHFMSTNPTAKRLLNGILNWGKYDTPGTEAYELAQGSGLIFSKDIADEIEWETKENPRLAARFRPVLGL